MPRIKQLKVKISEKEIQKQILQFLTAYKIFVFRNNTTGVYDPVKKIFRPLSGFSLRGVADILGLTPEGRFLAIEVKTATGRQTFEQKQFEDAVKANNGIYILARSIDDVRWLVEAQR